MVSSRWFAPSPIFPSWIDRALWFRHIAAMPIMTRGAREHGGRADAVAEPQAREGEPVQDAHGPSVVGLMRLSSRLSFPSGGEAMYRSILRLVDLSAASEFVMVPCGRGRGARFIAEATGASGAGIDPDPEMVDIATRRARRANIPDRLHFEEASFDALPYQDEVFDLAIGELELGAAREPLGVLSEMVRVTRPGGTIVLVQLVAIRTLDEARGRDLVPRLGVRPRTLVEWKQMLRDVGVIGVTVEDWSDTAASHNGPSVLGSLAELFTLRVRLRLLPRAWKRWGWPGVRTVLTHEKELRHLLEEERALGVHLIKGTRRADAGREAQDEE